MTARAIIRDFLVTFAGEDHGLHTSLEAERLLGLLKPFLKDES